MKKLLVHMFFIFAFVYGFGSAVLDLVRDTMHRGDWIVTTDWGAKDAECTRIALVVSSCSVKAVRLDMADEGERHLHYITFANWGGEGIEFVRSAQDPDVVTLRQAADGLGGRWAVVFTLLGLGALLTWQSYRSQLPDADDLMAPGDRSGEVPAGAAARAPAGPGGPGPRKTFGQRTTPPPRGR